MPTSNSSRPPRSTVHSNEWLERTLEQFANLIREAASITEQKSAVDRELAAAERLRYGWEKLKAAYSLEGASEVITEGRWSGFTRRNAIAWNWNLFQYEPSGFTHPGSQVRAEALQLPARVKC